MESNVVIALVRAHQCGDESEWDGLVCQLVAGERRAKHEEVARRIEAANERRRGTAASLRRLDFVTRSAPPFVQVVDPRATLASMTLRPGARDDVERFVEGQRRAGELAAAGLRPARRAVFHGPPGNGKTTCAEAVAAALGLPLFYAALGGMVDSLLGGTGANVAKLFDFAARNAGVVFIDEFDAVGWRRDADGAGGDSCSMEGRRIVSAILQTLDRVAPDAPFIAATNAPGGIDPALWRRFDVQVRFDDPDAAQASAYLATLAAGRFDLEPPRPGADYVAAAAGALSLAGVERAFNRCARDAVLAGHRRVTAGAMADAVEFCRERGRSGGGR